MTAETTTNRGAAPRVTKRRAETRARLLDAAYHVFADKGFGHVRIDDVCAAAGYTRGAFYSQFDSLDELFFILYDQRADLITEQVASAITVNAADLSAHDGLDRVTATLLLDRDWLLVKTDFLMYAARHPDVARRLIDHRAHLRDAIEDHLASLDTAVPWPLTTPRDAARAIVAAYDGVTVQLLLDQDTDAARTWLNQLLTALFSAAFVHD